MNLKNSITAVIILHLLISNSLANAQKIEHTVSYITKINDDVNTRIIYKPNTKLSIADFKGKSDEYSPAIAITSSGFTFKAGYKSDGDNATVNVTVYCSFDKQSSWMKNDGKTPYILSHEQLHFDISYIHSLLFIERVKKLSLKNEKYMKQLKDEYYAVIEELDKMQNKYDAETQNGILKDKQAEWQTKIEKQLISLEGKSN